MGIATGMAQEMSDMLQLVVEVRNDQLTSQVTATECHDKLKHIGHSLSGSVRVESTQAGRQAEVYRTSVA